jgi:hypothetical protein
MHAADHQPNSLSKGNILWANGTEGSISLQHVRRKDYYGIERRIRRWVMGACRLYVALRSNPQIEPPRCKASRTTRRRHSRPPTTPGPPSPLSGRADDGAAAVSVVGVCATAIVLWRARRAMAQDPTKRRFRNRNQGGLDQQELGYCVVQ